MARPTSTTTTTTVTTAVKSATATMGRTVMTILGLIVLVVVLYYAYQYFITGATTSTTSVSTAGDLVPSSLSGKAATTIASTNFPAGENNNYGLNFWMYIKDWDTNFGKEKTILKRGDGNPLITLHPTDNSLNVKVAIYPAGTATAPATPSATGSTSSAGDVYTCTVENVPLQAWFAVSVTVFQRNLDIYINGQLVKSCVLPGVPKLAAGDVVVGDASTGFSGSVCTMKYLSRTLVPSDALSFFSAGTPCGTPGGTVEPGGFTLFGYTFRFSIFRSGETEPTYTLGTS